MKTLLVAAFLTFAPACFAGRAFPVVSDSFASGLFQEINSIITKDPTNFLVDLSGRYSTCDRVGERGPIVVERKAPDGATIGGLVDYTRGEGTNAAIAHAYIKQILSTWPSRSVFSEQIRRAEKYGCSVEPGCKGYAVVACLFSPEYTSNPNPGDISNTRALAFTPEQYELAENYLGMEWDRSHFLENLSAKDAECGMIDKESWDFKKANEIAKEYEMRVSGMFGNSPNLGDTQAAMGRIMSRWKEGKWNKVNFSKMGCSVIPGCKTIGGGEEVVVSCLYPEAS